ncbi:MAG: helix-turn-helix transcriptional regulator [Pseudomonas sp.]
MLPDRKDVGFPEALKAAREAKGLSYTELAHAIGLNPVMPSRYENRDHSCFGAPRKDTWVKLNKVLFGTELATDATPDDQILLGEATLEELIKELKDRGATSVNVSF